jgi:hypothetical protein
MERVFEWRCADTISRKADVSAIPVKEMSVHPGWVYNERLILIHALEDWLWAEQRRDRS